MSLLNVSRLSFRYPSTIELFQDATFAIEPGDRLAIVGPNGAGKSTLLSILAGELDPTGGAVARRKDLRVAVADQQGAVTGSLFDHVFGAQPRLAARRARLAGTEHDSPCEYAELVNEFDAAGGYAAEARTESILTGLGFAPCEWQLPAAKLSGGQRTRAGLARALHTDADLLLLDEPTNHLDIAAREWLEEQLDGGRGACVLVSHDRTLLRHVATRVLEIERGQVTRFEGGYDAYRAKRALTERQAWQDYDASQRRKAAAEQASERRSRLAAQVATAPPGVRTSRDFYARKAAKVARTARLLRERADRGPQAAKPWVEQPIPTLEFAGVRRSGDVALAVTNLEKSYPGKPLFTGITFDLARGARLAITGPNGSGKTTFLRLLLGLEPSDGGTVRFGAHVTPGHYAQDAENLDRAATPLAICGPGTLARTLLACLKVRPDRVDRPLAEASAGERAKVALVRLLVGGANLLVLDEPTNHLDIEAQEALEKTLAQYPGTIVLVSHDRSFLEALAPDEVLALDASKTS
jgi:ATP-binding cassette subfamily F protein 3